MYLLVPIITHTDIAYTLFSLNIEHYRQVVPVRNGVVGCPLCVLLCSVCLAYSLNSPLGQ